MNNANAKEIKPANHSNFVHSFHRNNVHIIFVIRTGQDNLFTELFISFLLNDINHLPIFHNE
ncbi:MAG: hypothetical protein WCG25_08315 [bacterium]